MLLSQRSKDRIDAKLRELTPRNWGQSLDACIQGVNTYTRGWLGFFGICTDGIEQTLRRLDSHLRRRMRAIQLRHWKTKRTIARRLVQLGNRRPLAWGSVYKGRKSTWALSHTPSADRALRNAYFAKRGLLSLVDGWRARARRVVAPEQLVMALG